MQQEEEAELRLQGYGNEDPFIGTQKGLHRACLMQEATQRCCNGKKDWLKTHYNGILSTAGRSVFMHFI